MTPRSIKSKGPRPRTQATDLSTAADCWTFRIWKCQCTQTTYSERSASQVWSGNTSSPETRQPPSIHHPCGVTSPAAGRCEVEVERVDHTNKVEARFGSAALHGSSIAPRGLWTQSNASPTYLGPLVSPPSARQKFPNRARTRPLPQWMPCKKRQAAGLSLHSRQSLRRPDGVGNKTDLHGLQHTGCAAQRAKTICSPTRRADHRSSPPAARAWADHPKGPNRRQMHEGEGFSIQDVMFGKRKRPPTQCSQDCWHARRELVAPGRGLGHAPNGRDPCPSPLSRPLQSNPGLQLDALCILYMQHGGDCQRLAAMRVCRTENHRVTASETTPTPPLGEGRGEVVV